MVQYLYQQELGRSIHLLDADVQDSKVTGICQESRKEKGSVMLIEEIIFINETEPVSGNSDEALYHWR